MKYLEQIKIKHLLMGVFLIKVAYFLNINNQDLYLVSLIVGLSIYDRFVESSKKEAIIIPDSDNTNRIAELEAKLEAHTKVVEEAKSVMTAIKLGNSQRRGQL